MKRVALVSFAALAALTTCQAYLVTTSYHLPISGYEFTGQGNPWIPGFDPSGDLMASFFFDSDDFPDDSFPSYEYYHNIGFSVSIGDLTISTTGTVNWYYRGAIYVLDGHYMSFSATAPFEILGTFESNDGQVLDASLGSGSVSIWYDQGPYFNALAYGYYSADEIEVHELGTFYVGIEYSLGDNTFSAYTRIIPPGGHSIPEPSVFGLAGACTSTALAGFRRLKRQSPSAALQA